MVVFHGEMGFCTGEGPRKGRTRARFGERAAHSCHDSHFTPSLQDGGAAPPSGLRPPGLSLFLPSPHQRGPSIPQRRVVTSQGSSVLVPPRGL